MTGTALEEMGEDEVLAAAEACADTIRDAEAELLRLAYQWAILHAPGRLDPATAALPGREKARLYGGAGTPEVCEFAAAQLGVPTPSRSWIKPSTGHRHSTGPEPLVHKGFRTFLVTIP